MQSLRTTRGQAATELAIFGALLIFLIGAIVRSAVSSGYQQNQQYKAMRYALLQSYQSSESSTPATGRSSASVLYLEDRLSPDLLKHGPTDRSVYVAQGSGTMTNMLMYPLDASDLQDPAPGQVSANIPVTDMYINGKHFVFTTAKYESKSLNPPGQYARSYPASNVPDPHGNKTYRVRGWNFACKCGGDIHNGGAQMCYGCPIFYQIKAKCGTGCPADDAGILSIDESYDLNHNDILSDDSPSDPDDPKPAQRANMSWYWKGVNGVDGGDVVIDKDNGNYPSFDVDNDGQEETVYDVSFNPGTSNGQCVDDLAAGIYTGVTVLDYQDGDLDMTHDQHAFPQPGLQNDMEIYTVTNAGTVLLVKEGRLYNPEAGIYVRSTSQKDQAEIVQREIQLSNDTGHFCPGDAANPPIEACAAPGNDCFTSDNIKLTCFDRGSNMLYVRSRILDRGGRFWKTDASGKGI